MLNESGDPVPALEYNGLSRRDWVNGLSLIKNVFRHLSVMGIIRTNRTSTHPASTVRANLAYSAYCPDAGLCNASGGTGVILDVGGGLHTRASFVGRGKNKYVVMVDGGTFKRCGNELKAA